MAARQIPLFSSLVFAILSLSLAAAAPPKSQSTDESLFAYLRAQAAPHESIRGQLLDRLKDLQASKQYLQAVEVLDAIREESDFKPVSPSLLDGTRLDIGRMGGLGKVQVLDVVSDDAALFIVEGPQQRHLVLVRGLKGFTTLCNDCWIELACVKIVGTEPYDLVLKELRVEREGSRRDDYSSNSTTQEAEETEEEFSGQGIEQRGEQSDEVNVNAKSKHSKRKESSKSQQSNLKHRFSEDEITKILGPTKTVLVCSPVEVSSTNPLVASFWREYRAKELKLIDSAQANFFGELFKLEVGIQDGKCRVVLANQTELLAEDIAVRVVSRPAKGKPFEIKFDKLLPGKKGFRRVDWKHPNVEMVGKIMAARIAPPPPCSKCDGTRKVMCRNCSGKKIVKCRYCGGDGEVVKRGTRNTGEYQVPTAESFRCPRCDGNGMIKCTGCGSTGKVQCRKCKAV